MTGTAHKVAAAVDGFVSAAQDADDRHASINRYLAKVFAEITPGDLSDDEASALADALQPAFQRVTGAAALAPSLPDMLNRVAPRDLSSTEALLILTLLIPVHSRVIAAQEDGAGGRPVQRLLLAPTE